MRPEEVLGSNPQDGGVDEALNLAPAVVIGDLTDAFRAAQRGQVSAEGFSPEMVISIVDSMYDLYQHRLPGEAYDREKFEGWIFDEKCPRVVTVAARGSQCAGFLVSQVIPGTSAGIGEYLFVEDRTDRNPVAGISDSILEQAINIGLEKGVEFALVEPFSGEKCTNEELEALHQTGVKPELLIRWYEARGARFLQCPYFMPDMVDESKTTQECTLGIFVMDPKLNRQIEALGGIDAKLVATLIKSYHESWVPEGHESTSRVLAALEAMDVVPVGSYADFVKWYQGQ